MTTLLINGVVTVVVAAAFVWVHRANGRWSVLLFLAVFLPLALVLSFFSLNPPIIAICFLTVFGFIIRKETPQKIRIAGAATIAVGVTAFYSVSVDRETAYARSLQKEFPVVSIADKLAYEKTDRQTGGSTAPALLAASATELNLDVEFQLEQREELIADVRKPFRVTGISPPGRLRGICGVS